MKVGRKVCMHTHTPRYTFHYYEIAEPRAWKNPKSFQKAKEQQQK